ncbi:MAG: hypothetical protein IPJ34_21950 [Myxococcales bacterium]|nr:hypothetical protein [Myxococcales bacterium]
MATIDVEGEELVIHMTGLGEKLMALRSEVRLPLSHVKAVRARPEELFDDTFIFRVFGASLVETHLGYFWKKGDGLVFIDIHHLKEGNIVAVDLEHERMKHLYVEAEGGDAAAVAARITAALQPR